MSRRDSTSKKVELGDLETFVSNPFVDLNSAGLPNISENMQTSKGVSPKCAKRFEQGLILGKGERLEVRREKQGRGGKTVSTIREFPLRISNSEKAQILKKLKTRLGTGGTWNGSTMELQGDKRDEIVEYLQAMGFKPILAGG